MSTSRDELLAADVALTVRWLRGLAEKHGKGVVHNIDARSLGRIADMLARLAATPKAGVEREVIAQRLIDMGFTSRDGTVINGGTFGVIDAILSLSVGEQEIVQARACIDGAVTAEDSETKSGIAK